MWRMTPRLATAAMTATLALAALTTPEARASAVQSYSYSTQASLGDVPNGPITMYGVSTYNAQLTTPGAFLLGSFQSSPLPSTATLTYNHTLFTIDLKISPVGSLGYSGSYDSHGTYRPTPSYDYLIKGELNGSMTNGSSNMTASVTSITGSGSAATPPFPIADLLVTVPQGIAAPVGTSYGSTSLIAQVLIAGDPLPIPAPEPTSIAAFAVALAGWGLRRRLRARA